MHRLLKLGLLVLFVISIPLQIYLPPIPLFSQITVNRILAFAMFAIVAAGLVVGSEKRIRYSSLNKCVFLFVLTRILSLAVASDVDATWTDTKELAILVVAYFFALYGMSKMKDAAVILNALMWGSVPAGVLALYQAVRGLTWSRQFIASPIGSLLIDPYLYNYDPNINIGIWGQPDMVKAGGFFFNVNYFAAYLGYVIPVALALTVYANAWKGRLLYGSMTALWILNVILTYSRGGYVALAATVGVVLLVSRRSRLLLLPLSGLVLMLAGALMPASLTVMIFRWSSMYSAVFLRQNPRWALWEYYLGEIAHRPILGHGSRPSELIDTMTHAHSLPIMLAYSMGLAGLGLFAWLLLSWWRVLRNGHADAANDSEVRWIYVGILGALVWFAVQNSVDYSFFGPRNGMPFWLLLGTTAFLEMNTKEVSIRGVECVRPGLVQSGTPRLGWVLVAMVCLCVWSSVYLVFLRSSLSEVVYIAALIFVCFLSLAGSSRIGRSWTTTPIQ